MLSHIKDFFKVLFCEKELEELSRLKYAAVMAMSPQAGFSESIDTARWILMVGENKIGLDVQELRAHMRNGTSEKYLDWLEARSERQNQILIDNNIRKAK